VPENVGNLVLKRPLTSCQGSFSDSLKPLLKPLSQVLPQAMTTISSDLWSSVLPFAERPMELQALAPVCGHLAALVKSRRCWGRALRPFVDLPEACRPKDLRMACDWLVIRQLPMTWRWDLVVAGSFALHEAMVRRGLSPAWHPNDIDVYIMNGGCFELSEHMMGRLQDLGLTVDTPSIYGDYVTNDRFGNGLPVIQTTRMLDAVPNHDAKTNLEPGSCVIRRVIDLHYSFDGLNLGKLSLIATRPADPRTERLTYRYQQHNAVAPLTVHTILEGFDIDICRAGLLLPRHDLVFNDAAGFEQALTTMSASQRVKIGASEQTLQKEAQRRRKYEERGFTFS
jgi:hypothetical protein